MSLNQFELFCTTHGLTSPEIALARQVYELSGRDHDVLVAFVASLGNALAQQDERTEKLNQAQTLIWQGSMLNKADTIKLGKNLKHDLILGRRTHDGE